MEGALNGFPPAEDAARRSVPQVVCKAILQTVVRHAEEHDLERESEVQELLEPLSRLNDQKANQAGLALVVPMYLGLGASGALIQMCLRVSVWLSLLVRPAISNFVVLVNLSHKKCSLAETRFRFGSVTRRRAHCRPKTRPAKMSSATCAN